MDRKDEFHNRTVHMIWDRNEFLPIPYFRELAKREMPVYCVEKTPLSGDDFGQLHEAMNKPK